MSETMEESSGYKSDPGLGDEMFVLATNLLLYVLLIIVMVLLVHFYLDNNNSPSHGLYDSLGTDDLDGSNIDNDSESENRFRSSSADSLPVASSLVRSKSFMDFANWNETLVEPTQAEIMQRLTLCSIGLIISFLIWGVLQERMLTREYGNGEYFTYSFGLVFTSRLFGFIFSLCLMFWYKLPLWPSQLGKLHEFSYCAVSNMLSSWCQYEALRYVTFPTQMLSKAFKVVPILLMGKFLADKRYEFYEYMSAIIIGIGIAIFLTSSENVSFVEDSHGNLDSNIDSVQCGLVLLLLYLFFDSFTAQWQNKMFSENSRMGSLQMMLLINAFSTIFSFITLVHTGELVPFLSFVTSHPEIHLHFAFYSIAATVGQVFIFYTMKNFGPVVFAIIMNTRVLLSVLLSCFLYGHKIRELGVVGILIVFGSIFYRIRRKTEGKDIVVWIVNEVSKSSSGTSQWKRIQRGQEMLNEVHQHLDI